MSYYWTASMVFIMDTLTREKCLSWRMIFFKVDIPLMGGGNVKKKGLCQLNSDSVNRRVAVHRNGSHALFHCAVFPHWHSHCSLGHVPSLLHQPEVSELTEVAVGGKVYGIWCGPVLFSRSFTIMLTLLSYILSYF